MQERVRRGGDGVLSLDFRHLDGHSTSLPGQSDGCSRRVGWVAAQAIMAQTDIRRHLTPCLAPSCNAATATLSTDGRFQRTDTFSRRTVRRMLLVCLSTGSSNPGSPPVNCLENLTFNLRPILLPLCHIHNQIYIYIVKEFNSWAAFYKGNFHFKETSLD